MTTWRHELNLIAEKYNTTLEDILGPSREYNLVNARVEFANKMKLERNWSMAKIASIINRHPSTVFHYFNQRVQNG